MRTTLARGRSASEGDLCLLVGLANVGKTSFGLAFAGYLGVPSGDWAPEGAEGGGGGQPAGGDRPLVAPAPFTTRWPWGAWLPLRGRNGRRLRLVDSPALYESAPPARAVRAAAAQTLRLLLAAAVVLLVVDAAGVGAGAPLAEAERAVVGFASRRHLRLAVLASKADLPLARLGQARLEAELAPARVIPVCAQSGRGFREVRAFLAGDLP